MTGSHQPGTPRPYMPVKQPKTSFPIIDNDPHFKRVVGYARRSDYYTGAVFGASAPGLLLLMERFSPSGVGKGGFAQVMRSTCAIGAGAGFLLFYSRSINRFYGSVENQRELDMDMREMVDKVKKGEPLYGKSSLSPYMQGVAARNSQWSGIFLHAIPWFNFVNHEHHGVDTAKYYRQAERELAAEQGQNTGS